MDNTAGDASARPGMQCGQARRCRCAPPACAKRRHSSLVSLGSRTSSRHTRLFKLDEWVPVSSLDDVKRRVAAQFTLGARRLKRTEPRGAAQIDSGPCACNNQMRWWLLSPGGHWVRATHPPLRGRRRAVMEEERQASSSSSGFGFIPKAAAAYPSELSHQLANALIQAPGQLPKGSSAPVPAPDDRMMRVGVWHNVLVHMQCGLCVQREQRELQCRAPLRRSTGQASRTECPHAGGLRRNADSVNKVRFLRIVETLVRSTIKGILGEHPDADQRCITAIGS